MSKAILILDEMPHNCKECDIMFKGDYSDWCPSKNARTDVYDYIITNTKPDWCPLKELPEKHNNIRTWDEYYNGYDIGWNNCIDTILQEKIINED